MRPDKNSQSFTFHKNVFSAKSCGDTNKNQNCRKKLQDKFDQSDESSPSTSRNNDRSVLSVISINDTRRVLRTGTERITKTLSQFRTTLGTISQRFKMPTKRRQILEEGPMTPNCETPQTFSRKVLGRTPTKLYSPFSIESPYHSTTYDKENLPPPHKVISGRK